ncbi:MAG: 16S rRNA (cytidine(1402)-2'-O)-methyltransferase [Gammaproteobacteria bacterium]|nr:16S rRNA (cytidine(1402)-2'-O)-methyltransferase [Gammaproteobacteria bacterium]MDH5691537.1 16S rRNA (cytidine(1402)-2'-O)-methyltransferase [Gammaproteobacteria bacterium]
MSESFGTLYLVATPIGNLEDLSDRAKSTLKSVDLVLAEDTRHSKRLLDHIGVKTPIQSYHDHNEQQKADQVCTLLQDGKNIALISDAGTPLISDPGYQLVKLLHDKGIPVSPIPGPVALIAALSASGLPTDRFTFEGFLPATGSQRRKKLTDLLWEQRTLVFYESPHRIKECLHDMKEIFGGDRLATVCRELTKRFETVKQNSLEKLILSLEADSNQSKGEFVLVVHGAESKQDRETVEIDVGSMLETLLEQLPVKQAVDITVKLTGRKRKPLYQLALSIKSAEQ